MDSFGLLYLAVGGALVALGHGVRAYATEKGKNLATREDLEPVTKAIEEIRADAQARVEREKVAFAHQQLVNRTQYELELAAYRDVWDALLPVHRAASSLRNQFDVALREGESESERKRVRFNAFVEASNACSDVVMRHKPFYPQEVYDVLDGVMRLMRKEAIQYKHQSPDRNPRYYDDAVENMEAISNGVGNACEAIRSRLSSARVA